MIDSYLKSSYETFFVLPLVRKCRNISPITLTLLATCFGLLVPLTLFLKLPFLATFCLLLSGYLDTLDGAVARTFQKTSPLGAILDITSDRLVEFLTILGLFLVAPQQRSLLSLLMLGSTLICVTTFLVVGIFTPNTSKKGFYYSPGIMERAEAFFLWSWMILWPEAFPFLASLFSLLVFLTALIRIWEFQKKNALFVNVKK